jgi:FtsH-binding integral membrane protein
VVALNPDIQAAVFSSGIIVFGLIGAQLGLVLLISVTIDKLAPAMALGLFFFYAALMGVTLSVIFVGTTWGPSDWPSGPRRPSSPVCPSRV